MTEREWQAIDDPYRLLAQVEDDMTDRQHRLFACACCHRLWPLFDRYEVRYGVHLAEKFADGEVVHRVRKAAQKRVKALNKVSLNRPEPNRAAASAVSMTLQKRLARFPNAPGTALRAVMSGADAENRAQVYCAEYTAQASLLKDIVANHFFRVRPEPSWRTTTVTSLAQGIYDERAFDRLPILADALQDAGCENEDVLIHCRGEGPHVRGCWVVDLVLSQK